MHRCPPPSSQERGGSSSGARLRPALICIHERRVARGGQGRDLRGLSHQDSACGAGPLLHPSSDSLRHHVPRLLSLLLACAEERDTHGRRAGDIHSGLCPRIRAHETFSALEGTVRGSGICADSCKTPCPHSSRRRMPGCPPSRPGTGAYRHPSTCRRWPTIWRM